VRPRPRDRAEGLGVVLTAVARYLAPPPLGLGAAAQLATGHMTGMFLLALVLLAELVVAVRNAYGMPAAPAVVAAVRFCAGAGGIRVCGDLVPFAKRRTAGDRASAASAARTAGSRTPTSWHGSPRSRAEFLRVLHDTCRHVCNEKRAR
jgi:hypothetical protein